MAYIDGSDYYFDRSYLLLDMSIGKKEQEPFKLLKLFSEDNENLKLLKYFISQKGAIFFFKNIADKNN